MNINDVFLSKIDNIEISYSNLLEDGTGRVYAEKSIHGGFHFTTYYLPEDRWGKIVGFSDSDIKKIQYEIERNEYVILGELNISVTKNVKEE